MENPLLIESPLPYGAPQFDKIRNEHYLPAFKESIAAAKAEIDSIVSNPEEPSFENTIEALAFSGSQLNRVAAIFYNLLEAESDEEMQSIAEELSPMMTEYSMYVSLNEGLFKRIQTLWENRDSLGLDETQYRLLDQSYKSFARGGALLSAEDKKTYSSYQEEMSLLSLKFSNNVLAATNSFRLDLSNKADLEGLPNYVVEMGAERAKETGKEGWVYDLSYPSYSAFMQFSPLSELKKKFYLAYNSRAFGDEYDNSEICRRLSELRLLSAQLLGYKTYADYVVEERMAENVENVNALLEKLYLASYPAAKKEIADILDFAKENGYTEDEMQAWDFSYWAEKYKISKFELSDEDLKPYFKLEDCIEAVLGLATRLYGLNFTPMPELPGYNEDVVVYDVSDSNGKHMALFYADFFPREGKRNGAWMTVFREQSIKDGVETRPIVSIVTNFSKPTGDAPSLLTHYELTTFLHEFGHALHGILAEGRYPSQTGTNVAYDFVELPSQIMENWAYEPEFLKPFAKHYLSGEEIPDELIEKIALAKNYNVAYAQVRQLQFGFLDYAWHTNETPLSDKTLDVEREAVKRTAVFPVVDGCCISTSFNHIFAGGYSAGYYSYKWSEVLAADAWSLFKENGIFNKATAKSFRDNILSKGDSEPAAVLYRNFRGHDPAAEALLKSQGIK